MIRGRFIAAARAATLAAAFLVSCTCLSGCSDQAMSDLGNALADMYDSYGQDHLHLSEDHMFYGYRHEMHRASYAGDASVDLNGGQPFFTSSDIAGADPDAGPVCGSLGAGTYSVTACLQAGHYAPSDPGDDVPDDPRGYEYILYPGVVDGQALYHRLELLPASLGGGPLENGFFTCTAYAWKAGLSDLYRQVEDFLESCDGAVLLRVTAVRPALQDIPDGFLFEARSCGDDSLRICRYVYNVQPGIGIDYGDGSSWMEAAGKPEDPDETQDAGDGEVIP